MLEFSQTRSLVDAFLAKDLLSSLDVHYPGFEHWYINKCMPGVLVGDDVMIVAKDQGKLVGVALGKKREDETKLRCVRVLPQYQNRGAGLHLIDRMLKALDCDKPHCTVSEELLHQYSRAFVNRYHFDLTEVVKGLYRKQKLEYVFNAPALFAESAM